MKKLIRNLTFICILMLLAIMFPIYANAMELEESETTSLRTDFSNLEPDENYFFLLVKDADAVDPLDGDNLIYADQKKADKKGKVSFSYVPGYSGMAYVKLYGKHADQMRELTWDLSASGTLTIYGSGEMERYGKANRAPWYPHRKDINEVVIKESITKIGAYAFEGCSDLKNIYFEGNAPEFEENCFYSLDAVVKYPHDNDTWSEEIKKDYGGNITWVVGEKYQQIIEGKESYSKAYGDEPFELDAKLTEGDGELIYTSSAPEVAEVSDGGKVMIRGIGTAKITVEALETDNYNKAEFVITIVVSKGEQAIEGTMRYEKQIEEKSFVLDTVFKTDHGKLGYVSSKPYVVTVNDEGLVTINGIGEAKITITAQETEYYKPCAYQVSVRVAADKIQSAIGRAKAEYEKKLAEKNNYIAESWNRYEQAVAKAEGLLAKEGTTLIELQEALKAIEAAKPVPKSVQVVKMKKIAFPSSSYAIAAGKKVKLKPQISPRNASDKTLVWSVSNKKYATVKNGMVTTKRAGAGKKVVITATAKDGSGVRKKVTVKIMKHAVRKINLMAAAKTVKAGSKVKVRAAVKTTGSKANRKLEWVSSNVRYATVSKKGVVKTKRAGKGKIVKITAKSTDGTNKKATVKIRIK